MTVLEKFQFSQAWSNVWNLPTCPDYNNPWIYMAYAQQILEENKETLSMASVESFGELCREERGLYNRWPNGRGGLMSHDELIGMSYLSSKLADAISEYIYYHDGIYNNTREMHVVGDARFDLKRIIFAIPYIRSRAGIVLSTISQLVFSSHIIASAFKKDAHASMLRINLMRKEMSKYFICKMAYKIWDIGASKSGLNKKQCLEKEIEKYQVYAQTSKETWG